MTDRPLKAELLSPSVETYLLGQIDFGRCLQLQQRLIEEIGTWDNGQIVLLICEHPPLITVGRAGSPEQILSQSSLLRTRQIEVRWVNRGGGCLVHCPGQLAIYPLVPLRWHGFSVGQYLSRLQHGIVEALAEVRISGRTIEGRHGVWGRTGQLAAVGVAVRNWVSYYGAYLNVCPPMGLLRLVEADWENGSRMASLVAEQHRPVRMPTVRAAVVARLAAALGCQRYHLYTGHPLLRNATE